MSSLDKSLNPAQIIFLFRAAETAILWALLH